MDVLAEAPTDFTVFTSRSLPVGGVGPVPLTPYQPSSNAFARSDL